MNVISEFFGNLRILIKAVGLKPPDGDAEGSIGLMIQANAAQRPNDVALVFEEEVLTWSEFNRRSNQMADFLQKQGVRPGNCVSLCMQNRTEFLVCLVGILKLGAVAGLINHNLRHQQLTHCITLINSTKCIFGEEVLSSIEEIRSELTFVERNDNIYLKDSGNEQCPSWAIEFNADDPDLSCDNPPSCERIKYAATAYYIFTSGTTGLPKAAIMSHKRSLTQGLTSAVLLQRQQRTDRMYNCLPLYHATGLNIGWLSTVHTGAATVIRRKLSVSRFWEEVRKYDCTCFVYIGEFLRYLMSQPESPNDSDNPVTTIVGNGLRPDIWMGFKKRFNIDRIAEFYGASEGNAGFGNLLNKNCTVGMGVSPMMLASYDIDNDELVRDENGYCIPVAPGEAGLLLLKITDLAYFEGYTSETATNQKVIHNVDSQGGSYFNTGDLMSEVKVGFAFGLKHYQFIDRVGDTYRWKSENVSTTEVSEIINQHPDIDIANVYGVEIPGTDGRAGMAALVLREGLATSSAMNLDTLSLHIRNNLPNYAQPVFLRILKQLATTATMKLQKSELREQAFHPDKCDDELLFLSPDSARYTPLDASTYKKIMRGEIAL